MTGKFFVAASALGLLLSAAPEASAPTTLQVTIERLRSSKGTVRLCLWSDSANYPDCKKNSQVVIRFVAAAPVVKVEFDNLKPGKYAITAMHDENDNRKLDTSLFGKPREGFGFSNNAKGSFGPPKFEKVQFVVDGHTEHTMRMRYLL